MIAIEHMKMPKNCSECPFKEIRRLTDFYCVPSGVCITEKMADGQKPTECPLLEVKTLRGKKICQNYLLDNGKDATVIHYIKQQAISDMARCMAEEQDVVKYIVSEEKSGPELDSIIISAEAYIVKQKVNEV